MRTGLILLIAAASCAQDPKVVELVVVRDRDFQVIRTLDNSRDLVRFSRIWGTRKESAAHDTHRSSFPYKLDITANDGSGRWLYRPDGSTTLLSYRDQTVYVVADPAALNLLLGIGQSND